LGRCGNLGFLDKLGLPVGRVLHGRQRIEYKGIICAGDVLTFTGEIVDIYSKKAGALDFIEQELRATNQLAEHVVTLHATAIVRNTLVENGNE
jgi:hypothetical protein